VQDDFRIQARGSLVDTKVILKGSCVLEVVLSGVLFALVLEDMDTRYTVVISYNFNDATICIWHNEDESSEAQPRK
jgi:hypothetical protein